MKIQKYLLSAIVITAVVMTIFPSVAFAEDATQGTQGKEARCTQITAKIDKLIIKLQDSELVKQNRHQQVIDRLNTIITKLETNNVNVDKLKADVTSLVDKKANWQQEYAEMLTKLDATKQYACGESEGQFMQAVKDARAQRAVMHESNMDFWNFVKNTVKPDIQAVRDQLKQTTAQ